ncbi:MAG: primosomal protein N', partial [Bacteroidota bacterium]
MSLITLFADIIIPVSVPNLYTYRIPKDWNELCVPGKRVIVQFGKSKYYTGVIRNIHEKPPKQYEAKYLESILDDEPIVNEIQMRFWDWLSFYYMCCLGEVMNAALPSGLKLDSQTKIGLNHEKTGDDFSSLSDKDFMIVESLQNGELLTIKQVGDLIGVKHPQAHLKKLAEREIIYFFEEVKNKYRPKKIEYFKLNDIYK